MTFLVRVLDWLRSYAERRAAALQEVMLRLSEHPAPTFAEAQRYHESRCVRMAWFDLANACDALIGWSHYRSGIAVPDFGNFEALRPEEGLEACGNFAPDKSRCGRPAGHPNACLSTTFVFRVGPHPSDAMTGASDVAKPETPPRAGALRGPSQR